MPALKNPRHEHFSRLLAGGMRPTQAYVGAGFAAKGAAPSASRLAKSAAVADRIAELIEIAGQSNAIRVTIDRDWVLMGLRKEAETADTASSRVRAYELLGKELGMFTERRDDTMKWDGDLSKLDAGQLEKVKLYMEEKHYGDDKERMEREKAAYEAEWIAQHAAAEDDGGTIQ